MTTPSSTPGDMGAEPPGLPDSAMLARLANELFAEHLGALDQPATSPGPGAPGQLIGPSLPAIPSFTPSAAPGQPGGPAGPAIAPPVDPSLDLRGSIPNSLDRGAEVRLPVAGRRPPGGDTTGPARPSRPRDPGPALGRLVAITSTTPPSAWLGAGRPPAPMPPGTPPVFYFVRPDRWAPGPDPDGPGPGASAPFDPQMVRGDFPILAERVNGRQLVWLDNAATTQKPRAVIDRLTYFYEHENSNIHRGAHELAARATDAYEAARRSVARFLGAPSSDDIVFVRGTTEAINLVAKSWGPANVGPDDEILLSHLEHHANIVPWQQLAEEQGARLRVIPVDDRGQLLLDEYRNLLNDRTRLVAVTHVSNALGTVVPVGRDRPPRPTPPGPGCSSTAPSRCPTCASTSRPSTPTSTSSPATRSSVRPASGPCTASPRCWSPCLPGRAAAT